MDLKEKRKNEKNLKEKKKTKIEGGERT